jgi:hypothetical protein
MNLSLLLPEELPMNDPSSSGISKRLECYNEKLLTFLPDEILKKIAAILKTMGDPINPTLKIIDQDGEELRLYDGFFNIDRVRSLTPTAAFFRSLLICHEVAIRHYLDSDKAQDLNVLIQGMSQQVQLLERVVRDTDEAQEAS